MKCNLVLVYSHSAIIFWPWLKRFKKINTDLKDYRSTYNIHSVNIFVSTDIINSLHTTGVLLFFFSKIATCAKLLHNLKFWPQFWNYGVWNYAAKLNIHILQKFEFLYLKVIQIWEVFRKVLKLRNFGNVCPIKFVWRFLAM